jgi:hypothetical protein
MPSSGRVVVRAPPKINFSSVRDAATASTRWKALSVGLKPSLAANCFWPDMGPSWHGEIGM